MWSSIGNLLFFIYCLLCMNRSENLIRYFCRTEEYIFCLQWYWIDLWIKMWWTKSFQSSQIRSMLDLDLRLQRKTLNILHTTPSPSIITYGELSYLKDINRRKRFIFSNLVYQKQKILSDRNVWRMALHEAISRRISENDHMMNLTTDSDHYLHWHVPR